MLTQIQRNNVELIKRKNMSEKKKTLPTLRNPLKNFKLKTKKANRLVKNIPTDNITSLNKPIYVHS